MSDTHHHIGDRGDGGHGARRARHDLVIIGAGPAGLACAIQADEAGLDYVLLEKGCLVNSIFHFPRNMVFFSSPERLELARMPFASLARKPSRAETVEYYRRVAERFAVRVRQYEPVVALERDEAGTGGFVVTSVRGSRARRSAARAVVVATGFFDWPRRLGVPGEELPKVVHRFDEGHPYYDRDVAVVGGRSAAAEAALELQRAGARVTLVHRGERMQTKYWILPELENRIARGEIGWLPSTTVERIDEGSVTVRRNGRSQEVANDAVIVQIGYRPDLSLLEGVGVRLEGPDRRPRYDPDTCQTDVPGVFVCGSVCAGDRAGSIFIETARFDGEKIVGALTASATSGVTR
ncbi:MAG: YpdA family putative bacillithiol disulfide reductase [Spirochaetaceae bacterium]|nr:YpdA family putative bacillithiol disulfide reductase [Spirochaetaceae bacterium]